ncbi:MAG: Smr/MutS family protein [Bacteroidia bacterium]|nr:Smr/MutS family protein [Bacteroidia bacterium]
MDIYPSNFESKIGFDKVREILQGRCLSTLGKEKVDECNFSSDREDIERQLDETIEFVKIISEGMNFPNGYFIDMRAALQRSKVAGTFLEVFELFDLRRSLETVRAIVAFFRNTEEGTFPRLRNVVQNVQIFPFIYERIDQIINKHGQIKDNASPELSQIRRDMLSLQSSISKIMSTILRKMQAEGLVEKDISVSIRDGRAVIPVGAANKRKIKGIIHDESATGKTAYVEPEEIVETNNRIRELEAAERREIVKILTRFTDDIRPYADDIAYSYLVMAILDFIRSKAIWAIESKSVKPVLLYEFELDWITARHPLLEINLAREQRKIVPLDIRLDKTDRILLISGPNAGGKSVCLKTVGLLQYMVQCGIPIPVQVDSRTCIFRAIFMDIGDDQSLDNDLSTYSSHLYNMKFFVRNCSPDSLVLIDEFGTGTEPMLGGAIAESILNKINELGSFGVITTHYTNLKHFASSAPGIANGAMLYDSHKMEPLFLLQIGKPGSSFAFEIARKIGLPEEILQDATNKIGVDHIDFDKHLREIVRDKKYWESKRQKIRQEEKRIEELAENYETGLAETKKLRKEILDKAKREAEEIVSGANRIIEKTIRDIKEADAGKERTQEARQKLEDFKAEISRKGEEDDERILRKMAKLKQNELQRKERPQKVEEKKKMAVVPRKAPAEIEVGGWVRLPGQDTLGEVLEIKSNKITVAFGHLRSVVKRNKLESVSRSEVKRTKVENKTKGRINQEIGERKLVFKPNIDVRGLRAEEALQKIREFVDEAIMVDASELHILHGKGNGILRELIQNYLRTEPAVRNCHDEHVQFGGSGITIVELG